MSTHRHCIPASVVTALIAVSALVPLAARNFSIGDYLFATPVFGIATAHDGSLLVADAGAGIVRLRHGKGALIAELPGVTDIAPTGPQSMFAITGGGPGPMSARLFRVFKGNITEIANLGAFEATVNPDPPEINPNPFDVANLGGGSALVADAGGNSLLIVDAHGNIDWIATLPNELVSTANVKQLLNCPSGPPGAPVPPPACGLPPMIPAQPVATSVAIGPDGAYYVGELKGFPAPTGESRIWRIKPHARHAKCGTSPDCKVVADGFTSIVDLTFGRDGTLYVVELDEASWFAIEVAGIPLGGTVNACERHRWTDSWECEPVATGLTQPIAATVNRGKVFVVTHALEPGAAEVIALPRSSSEEEEEDD